MTRLFSRTQLLSSMLRQKAGFLHNDHSQLPWLRCVHSYDLGPSLLLFLRGACSLEPWFSGRSLKVSSETAVFTSPEEVWIQGCRMTLLTAAGFSTHLQKLCPQGGKPWNPYLLASFSWSPGGASVSCYPRLSLWTHFTLRRRERSKRKSGYIYAGLSNPWPPGPVSLHLKCLPGRLSWEHGRLTWAHIQETGKKEGAPQGVT